MATSEAQVAADKIRARRINEGTVRCPGCLTRSTMPHEVDGDECRLMQHEREMKNRDG